MPFGSWPADNVYNTVFVLCGKYFHKELESVGNSCVFRDQVGICVTMISGVNSQQWVLLLSEQMRSWPGVMWLFTDHQSLSGYDLPKQSWT